MLNTLPMVSVQILANGIHQSDHRIEAFESVGKGGCRCSSGEPKYCIGSKLKMRQDDALAQKVACFLDSREDDRNFESIGGKMRLKIRPAGRGDYPLCLHRSDSDGRSMRMKAMSSWSCIGAVIN